MDDFSDKPDELITFGFIRRDEETTDSTRFIWYEKTLKKGRFSYILQIEFELSISDDPYGSYSDNHSYTFNDIYLRIINEEISNYNISFDSLRDDFEVDKIKLNLKSIPEIILFCKMFS